MLHCSHLSTCLVVIDCAAYSHVLQAHDGPVFRHHGNLRACVENMRA
jgi:hypothetical protein